MQLQLGEAHADGGHDDYFGQIAQLFGEAAEFADVAENMRIAQEEIFGPVLAIMRAKDFSDAMRIANNIPFGLSASIQTTHLSRVFDFVYGMEAGLLTVNLPSAGVEYQLPFGGTKDSSFGPKEQGPAAMEFYSDYTFSLFFIATIGFIIATFIPIFITAAVISTVIRVARRLIIVRFVRRIVRVAIVLARRFWQVLWLIRTVTQRLILEPLRLIFTIT